MNAILLVATLLALGAQPDVQTSSESKTQLYVKTVPPGAEVTVDGKVLGKSDGLFNVSAGSHKLSLSLEGHAVDERSVQVSDGQITRVEVELKKRMSKEVVLSYVGDSSEKSQSFADSGHAVAFQRPMNMKSISAVKLFGTRYGAPEPPDEDFHIYLLDQSKKVLEHITVPYSKIERGDPRWYTIEFPAVEVPGKFFVALWFKAEATKGVHLGKQTDVQETHSYVGLPDRGYDKVKDSYDWMIRAVVSSDGGKKPSYPKVKTYEEEKAADTESTEAQPENGGSPSEAQGSPARRTWTDKTGAFTLEAEFVGVENGKVNLKKADGRTVAVSLDSLSKEDQDYVADQTTKKPKPAEPAGPKEVRTLSHDTGNNAGQSSIAGGGHAVKFKVDDDSFYITSVSLFGSRYGMPEPPKESFKVWICDSNFKPIATFRFPYSSYIRGEADWKLFRLRPTRVPKEFIVCFGFNPQQTKGVYVSYDDKPSENSMIGVPGKRPPKPFTKGNWLIRCEVEKRGGATKTSPGE